MLVGRDVLILPRPEGEWRYGYRRERVNEKHKTSQSVTYPIRLLQTVHPI